MRHGQRSADADPRSLDVAGRDLPFRLASIGTGEAEAGQPHPPRRCGVSPSQQSRAGRQNGQPRRVRPGSWSALPANPSASRSAQGSTSASKRRSSPFPDGIAATLATRGIGGGGCASTPGLDPVPGPRTGGSLASRPERPVCHGRPGRETRKLIPCRGLPPRNRCAPRKRRSAHRTPMSFARSGTAPTRSAGYRPTRPRRAARLERPCRRSPLALRGLSGSSHKRKRATAAARTTPKRSESPTTGHPMVGKSAAGTTANAALKFRRPVGQRVMRRCN